MPIHNVNWEVIIQEMADFCEQKFDTKLLIDRTILAEVEAMVEDTLRGFQISTPNIAKVASSLAFWIRKLKPISYDYAQGAQNHFLAINELVGLLVGLSICVRYYDDDSAPESLPIPTRILTDWVHSYRVNSHSPHSSVIAFELFNRNHLS